MFHNYSGVSCVHPRSFALICSSQHTSGGQSQAAQPVPVQPEVGEQWEEFLRYALEMQRQLAKGDLLLLSRRHVSVAATGHP